MDPNGELPRKIEQYRERYNNRRWAGTIVLAYFLLLVLPLLTAWITAPAGNQAFWTELGKNFALIGFSIIVLQFVLASRPARISHYYGLDMVLRYHKAMGTVAAVLLFFHPLLVLGGRGEWPLLYRLDIPWFIWLGKIALILVLIQAATGLLQRRFLEFEKWRQLHNQALFILALVVTHSWMAGNDLQSASMQVLWVLWAGVAGAAYLYHKAYRPLRSRRQAWSIKEVTRENHNVWTIGIEPPAGEGGLFYLPGQFHFLRFYRGNRRYDGEEHHFTISSSPTRQGIITSTIKESGDFTSSLKETRIGDIVRVQGPYGRFSFLLHSPRKDLVFIAGGIGITPLMSMLRFMRDTDSDHRIVLLYANRTERDIIFGDELALMAEGSRPRLRVAHVLTRPSRAWKGEYGHIDQGMIRRYCGIDIRGMEFYLCGPPGLMKRLMRELKELGALPGRIHGERFWF